ncbi:MAG: hypothetical protein ABI867_01845 [Kofleriaceae bacterium]
MAIVILGMHRSGTSCLAGMLAAGGIASAGEAVRNWDNARGHHERLDVVRLNEAVLAHSGGHYLSPPAVVRWTAAHASARDRLLGASIGELPVLVKDPRTLLVLAFWRASRVPYRIVGIVRHPLAVARSLESWRGIPLAEGVALWSAHVRVLAEDRARHGYPVVDFDAPKAAVVAVVAQLPGIDVTAAAAAYEEQLVHHDDRDAPAIAGLAEAVALYRQLAPVTAITRPAFPRAELAAFAQHVAAGAIAEAIQSARAALAAVADPAAVLVPVVTALVRARAADAARVLISEARLDAGLADLLHGKVLLALGNATAAVAHLEAACAVPHPFFQARHLLPQALRGAGRHADAHVAMQRAAREALYPHNPLATIAEWHWLDGERLEAVAAMQVAIDAAPLHRRGRLRTRVAEWLVAIGDPTAARAELLLALDEDPGYTRSRDVLEGLEES